MQSRYWHSAVGAVVLSVSGNSVTPSFHLQQEQVAQGSGNLGWKTFFLVSVMSLV